MRINLVLLFLVVIVSCNGSNSNLQQLSYPKLIDVDCEFKKDGIYLEFDFKEKLELDSVELTCYFDLENSKNYFVRDIKSKKIRIRNQTKIKFFIDRDYIGGDPLPYDSLRLDKNNDSFWNVVIYAAPIGSRIVYLKNDKNENPTPDFPYINYRVSKQKNGLVFTNVFGEFQRNGAKMYMTTNQ